LEILNSFIGFDIIDLGFFYVSSWFF